MYTFNRIKLIFTITTIFTYSLSTNLVFAQAKNLNLDLHTQFYISDSEHLPLWIRSRNNGSIPLPQTSGSLNGRLEKTYTNSNKKFDWGIGAETRLNTNFDQNELLFIQGYGKLKMGAFEIKGGRWRGQTGLTDTLLSSGSFANSGTALGIPQISISIPEFTPLPFTKGWLAIKGTFSHGWMGHVQLQGRTANVDSVSTYFHHKSLYGRIGQADSQFKLYAGFNHQAFWGNEKTSFGSTFDLSNWQSYQSVLYGRNWANSKVGNHLGSIDVGLEIDLTNSEILLYRQFFYEVGALAHFANISDGLNGISIKNTAIPTSQFVWKKITIEYLNSMSQAGKLSNPVTPTGSENYYNHYLYQDGWSYKGIPMGNSIFTAKKYAASGQVSDPNVFFISNKISAIHTGMHAEYKSLDIKLLATYATHHGLYSTGSEPYRSIFKSISYPNNEVPFKKVSQFSMLLNLNKEFNSKKDHGVKQYLGIQFAFDNAGILNKSSGLLLKYGIKIK